MLRHSTSNGLGHTPKFREQATFPLIPGEDGAVLTKQGMIQGFRGVIALTGTPVDRPGGDGVLKPRFEGHVLRVGAQWLSKLGLAVNQIQLLGRWSYRAPSRETKAVSRLGD